MLALPPNIPRTLVYLPALMASAVAFREKEWSTGSHMLDCPEQNHMSPKTTPVMVCSVTFAGPAHPRVHLAVMLNPWGAPLEVAAVGRSSAFHELIGLFHGFQPTMSYGGHAAFGHGRTPNPSPKGCAVAVGVTVASTVYGAPESPETVTVTAVAANGANPYTAALAGARCSTMPSPKA